MEFLDFIPQEFMEFIMVTLFSLVIGLAQRRLHSAKDEFRVFGTDRTFTFIGILGYLLFLFDPMTLIPYLGGGLVIAGLLSIYYYHKLMKHQEYGITTIVVAMITYCIPPLVITQPAWLVILVVVIVLILTEMKSSFVQISRKFDKDEFVTLAKFLAIAGVILPIIPDEPFVPFLQITPFDVWMAVVVISGISYASYLLRKFVFVDSGILISGVLGGLYSSTAATIILARKGNSQPRQMTVYAAAIILAIAMMYLRIWILMLIFSPDLAWALWLPFTILTLVSVAIGTFLYWKYRNIAKDTETGPLVDRNPLEFKVAMIFTLLFVSFSFITYYVMESYGIRGLNILSWIVGLTDIDPFLLNLFQGRLDLSLNVIALATMQAIISNNILKTLYAVFISGGMLRRLTVLGIGLVLLVNGLIVLLML